MLKQDERVFHNSKPDTVYNFRPSGYTSKTRLTSEQCMSDCNSVILCVQKSMVSCEMQKTNCEISVVQMGPKCANEELKVVCLHTKVIPGHAINFDIVN